MRAPHCFCTAALLLALAWGTPAQGNNRGGLPPPPAATTSALLTTEISGIGVDKEGEAFVARYTVSVVPTTRLPADVHLEVKFENPADKEKPLVLTHLMKKDDERAMLTSPAVTGMKCGLYRTEISIYDSAKKEKLLGTHTQMIRSTYDLSKIKRSKDLESPSKC